MIKRMIDGLLIRSLNETDPEVMAAAFGTIGWVKPAALFQRYLAEQASGTRICLVAALNGAFAGYVTVNWEPAYPGFAEKKIPEIQDLNVLPCFRRKGIGTTLLDQAEAQIGCRSEIAGIGVGLHPGYNDAQRLYGRRGYFPDGRGITYKNRYVREGEYVVLDDDLTLHLIRRICR
jgi:GNAT superfamily N-acetyltransferase